MPKQKKDNLLQLVSSLEKAEKRHFRMFVNRNSGERDTLFLQLFDLLDKTKVYDEQAILKKIKGIKKQQLSNIKSNLYNQILTALRLYHRNKDMEIRLSEMVDYARVLYKKGLYKASLEILNKAKKTALESGRLNFALEAIDLEKHIELQHITGSMAPKAVELSEISEQIISSINLNEKLSSLSLNMYGLYLQHGYVRNEKDFNFFTDYFESNLPEYQWETLGFHGKVFLCQSYVWYSNMTQDFLNYYRWSARWVKMFDDHPEFKEREMPIYIKGLHNRLNALFFTGKYEKQQEALQELEAIFKIPSIKMTRNERSITALFYYTHLINGQFMSGEFTKSLQFIPEFTQALESKEYIWDDFRVTRFYYKIATLYFGAGDNETAIDYLNKIFNSSKKVRPDVLVFSRFLDLIAHFELNNMTLVGHRVKALYRFLLKAKNLDAVQIAILRFLRRIPMMNQENYRAEFLKLKDRLIAIRKKPYEKRAFLYLDFISWLESKIENVPIEKVIRRKFLET